MTEADLGVAYVDCVARVVALLTDDAVTAARVRACPAWTVREVIAHMTGLAEDWVVGNLVGYAGDAWTRAQVERHRDASLLDLSDMFTAAAARLVALDVHPLMGAPARWAFGDALIHEADLRETLAVGTEPPRPSVQIHLAMCIERWWPQLEAANLNLQIVAIDGGTFRAPDPGGKTALRVAASSYELWRMITGRRSAREITTMQWDGDPPRLLAIGLPYPFTIPAEPSDAD